MAFENYWNEKHKIGEPVFDDWLDKYIEILKNSKTKILDLGCGCGNDSLYLSRLGLNVVSCDQSIVALENVKQFVSGAETILLDISKPLPFDDNSFDCIIADLSLHYFDSEITKKVMRELNRILRTNGFLFARVNSVNDTNYGANSGKLIEPNYYFVNGYNKRFFDEKDILKYFTIIGNVEFNEAQMNRYGKPKILYEIKVQKIR